MNNDPNQVLPVARTEEGPRPGLVSVAAVILAFGLMYFAREIFIPLALAIFFAFLLTGCTRRLENLGLGRLPAVAITMTCAMLVLIAVAGVVVYQSTVVVNAIPQYRANIREKLAAVHRTTQGWFGEAAQTVTDIQRELSTGTAPATAVTAPLPPELKPVRVQVVQDPDGTRLPFSAGALQVVAHPFLTLGIAIALTFFFLYDRIDLRDRLLRLMGEARLHYSTNALSDAGRRVSRYLVALAVANLFSGTAVAIGLLLIGVPNWFLWGVLTAVLRFVPFIGPLLAAVFPIALSLALSDTWLQPLLVLGWFILVDLFTSNLVEPVLYGTRTGASPTAILFSFILWTWLWGPFGIVLATPITVCLVALGRHISELEFLSTLLGDEPVFRPCVRLYQRLLAQDAPAARTILQDAGNELQPIHVFDRVVAPAIGRLATDCEAGLLAADRKAAVIRTAADVIRESPPSGAAAPADATNSRPTVLVWTTGHELEDALLGQTIELLQASGLSAVACGSSALISDVDDAVQRLRPSWILLLAATPSRARRTVLLERRWSGNSLRPARVTLILGDEQRHIPGAVGWWSGRPHNRASTLAQVMERMNAAGRFAQSNLAPSAAEASGFDAGEVGISSTCDDRANPVFTMVEKPA